MNPTDHTNTSSAFGEAVDRLVDDGSMTHSDAKAALFAMAYGAGANKVASILSIDPGNASAVIANLNELRADTAITFKYDEEAQRKIANLTSKNTRLMASAVEDAKLVRDLRAQIKEHDKVVERFNEELAASKKENELTDDERMMLASLRDQIVLHEQDNQDLTNQNNILREKLRKAGIEL